jgi:hypothetical protein
MINFDELFKNHQATRTDCGPLSIITYKKPESFEHGLRYIFDNELSTLTITGDWLKAIAVNVNNMGSPDRLYESAYEPHFGVCRYGDYELDFDIGYLNSKIVTKDKSNSYESLDYHEVEQHVKSVLGLYDYDLDKHDDEEAHAIHTIIQSILDMIDEGEIVGDKNGIVTKIEFGTRKHTYRPLGLPVLTTEKSFVKVHLKPKNPQDRKAIENLLDGKN